MSLKNPKSEVDEDNVNPPAIDADAEGYNGLTSPSQSDIIVPEKLSTNRDRLLVPPYPPIRPLSPDNSSILSIDEYRQLHSSIEGQNDSGLSSELLPAHTWKGKLQRFWIRNKGLAYMLVAQVFGVLMNVTTRLLEVEGNKGKGMHPAHILFARMSITTSLASGYMWYTQTPYFPLGMPEVRLLLIIRGLAGFFGVFGMYYSLLYLPLADATVITFLSPGIACWVCSLLLREPFTRVEKIGSFVSLSGVVLIARPTTLFSLVGNHSSNAPDGASNSPTNGTMASDASSYDDVTPMQRLSGVGVALIGVIGSSIVYVVIRWIGRRAHPLITVNYFAAWCTLVSTVAQCVLPGVGWLLPADLKDWGYLLFLGTCGFTMQFLLAAGLAYEKSSRATNMVYTSMLFALFFDKVIFGHTPGVMSILGSSLILGSAITVALQQDPKAAEQKGNNEGSRVDEESRTGLISNMRNAESSNDHGRLPVQEVQLRALR